MSLEDHAVVIQGQKFYPMAEVRKLFESEELMERRLRGATIVQREDDDYLPAADIDDLINHGQLMD